MSSQYLDGDVSSLIKQLNAFTHETTMDEATRRALSDAARSFAAAVEPPGDTVKRIAFSALESSVACIGCDIGLFEIMAKRTDSPLSTLELAAETKTDAVLLGRVLRYLASFGMIEEASEDYWFASNITRTLSVPGNKAGIHHHQDCHMPCYQVLPQFLADTKYHNPSNGARCAFQKAFSTNLLPFLWLQERPHFRDNFSQWIGASHEGNGVFLDVFDFESELAMELTPETPLFVDVGGGFGHQCALFKEKLPNIPGRVIFQDLPAVVARAPPIEGVEAMPYDFMTEQPITGAKAYYMRNIMHDHPDDICLKILLQVKRVMTSDSAILVDDMILPNSGANWRATQLDLTMMAGLAGIERTERQWYELMDAAGLKIQMISRYNAELCDGIIVARG